MVGTISGVSRRVYVIASSLLLAGCVLAGCGSQPAGDYSRVRAFAKGLTAGMVTNVGGASAPAERQFQAILRAVGVKPIVSVVRAEGGSAQLRWSWPLAGGAWTYTTQVVLSEHATHVWWPQWAPGVVLPGLTSTSQLAVAHPRGRRAPLLLADGRPVGALTLGGLTAAIQRAEDTVLGGRPGTSITLESPGRASAVLVSQPPTNGQSLRLTINRSTQLKADAIVNGASAEATLIAIRPSTGAIVAVSGTPSADAADLAVSAHAAPGSTWKTVDSLALIRARHFTPNSLVTCPLHYTLMGFTFKNDKYYPSSALGSIPLKTAVANSCNTAMLSQHAHLTYAELGDAARTLGLTLDHDLGFPAFFGLLPKPANEFIKAEDMIGQGDVVVSPLAMTTDIATIQRGATVVPWMIEGRRPAVSANVARLTGREDAYLKAIFREVVLHGTASGLLGLPGPPIIAKTGTAEFIQNNRDVNHTWMIAAQGDLAVCVYFNVGNFGADTSGPLVRQFLAGIGPH